MVSTALADVVDHRMPMSWGNQPRDGTHTRSIVHSRRGRRPYLHTSVRCRSYHAQATRGNANRTCSAEHSQCNMQHTFCNTQHITCTGQHNSPRSRLPLCAASYDGIGFGRSRGLQERQVGVGLRSNDWKV